jgi:hypothetical protein
VTMMTFVGRRSDEGWMVNVRKMYVAFYLRMFVVRVRIIAVLSTPGQFSDWMCACTRKADTLSEQWLSLKNWKLFMEILQRSAFRRVTSVKTHGRDDNWFYILSLPSVTIVHLINDVIIAGVHCVIPPRRQGRCAVVPHVIDDDVSGA